MFIVFYTIKIVYICVFMTCSHLTVCVTHFRIHGMYVYTCVCVCVYVDANMNSETEIHNKQSTVNIFLVMLCNKIL